MLLYETDKYKWYELCSSQTAVLLNTASSVL